MTLVGLNRLVAARTSFLGLLRWEQRGGRALEAVRVSDGTRDEPRLTRRVGLKEGRRQHRTFVRRIHLRFRTEQFESLQLRTGPS